MNEHYKEPVKRQVDDMMASVLKAVVSNISGSNMEVNIGKWLLDGIVNGVLKFVYQNLNSLIVQSNHILPIFIMIRLISFFKYKKNNFDFITKIHQTAEEIKVHFVFIDG